MDVPEQGTEGKVASRRADGPMQNPGLVVGVLCLVGFLGLALLVYAVERSEWFGAGKAVLSADAKVALQPWADSFKRSAKAYSDWRKSVRTRVWTRGEEAIRLRQDVIGQQKNSIGLLNDLSKSNRLPKETVAALVNFNTQWLGKLERLATAVDSGDESEVVKADREVVKYLASRRPPSNGQQAVPTESPLLGILKSAGELLIHDAISQ